MLSIAKIRAANESAIVVIGLHRQIIQSILDFDFMCGRAAPRVRAIISAGRVCERFFWGTAECSISVYQVAELVPEHDRAAIAFFVNVTSGRRTLSSTRSCIECFPNVIAGTCFAENVPEQHALELKRIAQERGILIAGPASVGVLVSGAIKLGAIGGVDLDQIQSSQLMHCGSVAVLSSSGGMTNELIGTLAKYSIGVSFAIAFGGERFPILSPAEAFMLAQEDTETSSIVYFGELGGTDEYEIAELLREKRFTKPAYGYIAGSIESIVPQPIQFGHAKALSQNRDETAAEKKQALADAGMIVGNTYQEFMDYLMRNCAQTLSASVGEYPNLSVRKQALFSSRMPSETELFAAAERMSYPEMIAQELLGREARSRKFVDFLEMALKLLVDHGPAVSGAVNTMIAARAGKDIVSSLCAGLLTIGDRFGGAIAKAADNWLTAVQTGADPVDFVERFAAAGTPIAGIGHKKYSVSVPDPRVERLMAFLDGSFTAVHSDFARNVERITAQKKASLILNVDGAIACVMLDIFATKEQMDSSELRRAIDAGTFNAIFVLARSVGFVGHYLDQRRNDEGLFRLPEDEIARI